MRFIFKIFLKNYQSSFYPQFFCIQTRQSLWILLVCLTSSMHFEITYIFAFLNILKFQILSVDVPQWKYLDLVLSISAFKSPKMQVHYNFWNKYSYSMFTLWSHYKYYLELSYVANHDLLLYTFFCFFYSYCFFLIYLLFLAEVEFSLHVQKNPVRCLGASGLFSQYRLTTVQRSF